MNKFNVQFFVLAHELSEIVRQAINGLNVYLVVEGGRPRELKEIALSDLDQELMKMMRSSWSPMLYIMPTPPILVGDTTGKFLDANPDGIFVKPGQLTERNLVESSISGMAYAEKSEPIAQAIKRAIRKYTTSGTTAVSLKYDVAGFSKSSKYTRGALELEEKGIEMVQFIGGVTILLGDHQNDFLTHPIVAKKLSQ